MHRPARLSVRDHHPLVDVEADDGAHARLLEGLVGPAAHAPHPEDQHLGASGVDRLFLGDSALGLEAHDPGAQSPVELEDAAVER